MPDQKKPSNPEKDIVMIDPLEHVRLRPGMYVGGTDSRALHHLVYLVLDAAIEEALAGRCKHIWITLRDGNEVSIKDDGIGIAVELYSPGGRESGVSQLELAMTQVGQRDEKGCYKVSGGMMGVGIWTMNPLSAELKVEVARDGYLWEQHYQQGRRQGDVIQVRALRPDESTGTTITFKPDFTIMEPNEFSYEILAKRCRELAYLVAGLTITLRDERVKPKPLESVFLAHNGVQDFVSDLNREFEPFHLPIFARQEVEIVSDDRSSYKIVVEFAFQYKKALDTQELSFVNTDAIPDGGSHVDGMKVGITSIINHYARKMGWLREAESDFTDEYVLKGSTVVVSIQHPYPSLAFDGDSTRVKLFNPEIQDAVAQVVSQAFAVFAEQHPDDMRRIIEHCYANRHTR